MWGCKQSTHESTPTPAPSEMGDYAGVLPGETPTVVPGPDLGEAWTTEPDPDTFITLPDGMQVAPDQYLIMLDPSATKADAQNVADFIGGTIGGHIAYVGVWKVIGEPVSAEQFLVRLDILSLQPGVLAAAPVGLEAVQDDPCAAALADPVYSGSNSTPYDAIGVKAAWQALGASAVPVSSVHVGVFDTVLTQDPQGRIPWEFGDVSFVGNPKTTPDPRRITDDDPRTDGFNHGDGALGILAGSGQDGGIAGIASPLGSRLQVSHDAMGSPTDEGQPSKWAAKDGVTYTDLTLVSTIREIESGATIITTSVAVTTVGPGNASRAAIWQQLYVQMGKDHPNVLFVVAAGNNGQALDGSNHYPGGIASANVITVGNVDANGARVSTSNSVLAGGAGEVTLGAPGDRAVWGKGADGQVRASGGGTSSATAMVAGTAALVRAIAPDLTAEEIKKMLADTAAPGDASVGGKTLSMDSAVRETIDKVRAKLQSPLPPLTDAEISVADKYCEINVTAALTERLTKPPGTSRWEIRASVHDAKGPTSLSLVEGGLRPTNWRQAIQGSAQAVSWTILVPKNGVWIIVSRQDNGYWLKRMVRDGGEPTPSPAPSASPSPAPSASPSPTPDPTPTPGPSFDCTVPINPPDPDYIKWWLACKPIGG
jgi:hypothetical protein